MMGEKRQDDKEIMEKRRCKQCGEEFAYFRKNKSGRASDYCRECALARKREFARKSQAKHYAKVKKQVAEERKKKIDFWKVAIEELLQGIEKSKWYQSHKRKQITNEIRLCVDMLVGGVKKRQ